MAFLWNRHTSQLESAHLVDAIGAEDIACFEQQWLPPMRAKVEELKRAGQYNRDSVRQWNIEDAHWGWPAKFQQRNGQLQWSSYALRCGGRTQGLMFIDLVRRCRLPSQANQHMVYVDLVSTAPWNRPRLEPQPLYGGVGVVLVAQAVLRSGEEGFEGRLGLHALPGAEALYRDKMGMELVGPDPAYSGLPYYEFTPQRATRWLATQSS